VLRVRRIGIVHSEVSDAFFIAKGNVPSRLAYIRPITSVALDAVYSTVLEPIVGMVALYSMENRVGGSEGYVDVCTPE
jgi:hypothetical protein